MKVVNISLISYCGDLQFVDNFCHRLTAIGDFLRTSCLILFRNFQLCVSIIPLVIEPRSLWTHYTLPSQNTINVPYIMIFMHLEKPTILDVTTIYCFTWFSLVSHLMLDLFNKNYLHIKLSHTKPNLIVIYNFLYNTYQQSICIFYPVVVFLVIFAFIGPFLKNPNLIRV